MTEQAPNAEKGSGLKCPATHCHHGHWFLADRQKTWCEGRQLPGANLKPASPR